MGILLQFPARRVPQRTRHSEVDQEGTARLEPDNQILATAIDPLHALALELSRHRERIERSCQPRVVDHDAHERAPFQDGGKPTADRLDLGQLGHAATVVHASPVSTRMHADELAVTEALVRRLVDSQFPQWSGETLVRVPTWGTDN